MNMKTALFIAIVLISGGLAGIVHGVANLALVESYLDQAIGIENQHLFASGEEKDTPEFKAQFDSYRYWQKGGQVLAGTILGMSTGAFCGIEINSISILYYNFRIWCSWILSDIQKTAIKKKNYRICWLCHFYQYSICCD